MVKGPIPPIIESIVIIPSSSQGDVGGVIVNAISNCSGSNNKIVSFVDKESIQKSCPVLAGSKNTLKLLVHEFDAWSE